MGRVARGRVMVHVWNQENLFFGSTYLLRHQAYKIITDFQIGIRHPSAKDAIFITRLLHRAHHHKVGKDDFQAPGNFVKKIAILSGQKH